MHIPPLLTVGLSLLGTGGVLALPSEVPRDLEFTPDELAKSAQLEKARAADRTAFVATLDRNYRSGVRCRVLQHPNRTLDLIQAEKRAWRRCSGTTNTSALVRDQGVFSIKAQGWTKLPCESTGGRHLEMKLRPSSAHRVDCLMTCANCLNDGFNAGGDQGTCDYEGPDMQGKCSMRFIEGTEWFPARDPERGADPKETEDAP
ncbi:MAG: hypothetical protein M1832_003575 [Thelocarpon impressellum]|nr:MAG: hypothetical protein M1832_003575 [Thelocarpon impressellum]